MCSADLGLFHSATLRSLLCRKQHDVPISMLIILLINWNGGVGAVEASHDVEVLGNCDENEYSTLMIVRDWLDKKHSRESMF